MKVQSMQGTVAKLLTAGFLAGAVALAVPATANAQEVLFAGNPHPVLAGYYHDRRFEYDRFRAGEFRRHEEWRRERFDRRFDRRFYR